MKIYYSVIIISDISSMYHKHNWGLEWLNELGRWISLQLIQAYHKYGVDSRSAL